MGKHSEVPLIPIFFTAPEKGAGFAEYIGIQMADNRSDRIAAHVSVSFPASSRWALPIGPRLRRPGLYATVPTSSPHASTVITSLSDFSVTAIETAIDTARVTRLS
ncbi:hypothetical protein PQR75_26880 [Paraburkholderia fungorum]|uniref:hypothetical protein n=1 Tax=Paraburkholderia fungorum TaxID=134537 RepID=UPI0038BDBE49